VTTINNRQASYGATNNRLTSITQNAAAFRSYTYDTAGNTLTETRPGESFAYTYNNRNRLTGVTRNSASYATYGYNALEQLTTRTTTASGGPVGQVAYTYDLDGHLITEATAGTGVKTREYIWLPANDNNPVDLPLAVIDIVGTTATISTVHADHLGRPIRMTNTAKATVWAATWKPWGEVQALSGTSSNNLRYPGQYFQIETGLHYNHHRMYDPVTGRYTQPDPLRFVDGPSVYAYAKNSPFMYTDREGRCLEDLCIVEGIAAAAFIDFVIQLWKNNGHVECVDFREVALSGAIGGVTGGIGGRFLTGYLRGLSNTTKGNIGENLSIIFNRMKGSSLVATDARIAGTNLTTRVDSQWVSIFGNAYAVESKFGNSTLTAAQRIAQAVQGNAYKVERWTYEFFTGAGSVASGAATGTAVGSGSATNGK
jgi:RHS repeat-associated protein